MSEKATKVVVNSSNDTEFFVIAIPGMVAKWRDDHSIPLIDVVQNFEVFTTTTGSNTGEYIRPPKGILESAFGTSNVDDIVKKIVETGEEKGM